MLELDPFMYAALLLPLALSIGADETVLAGKVCVCVSAMGAIPTRDWYFRYAIWFSSNADHVQSEVFGFTQNITIVFDNGTSGRSRDGGREQRWARKQDTELSKSS